MTYQDIDGVVNLTTDIVRFKESTGVKTSFTMPNL